MQAAIVEREEQALRLVAVPAPGDVSTYRYLAGLHLAAKALVRHIETYRDTPAHPANESYRQERMARVEEDIADLRRLLDA